MIFILLWMESGMLLNSSARNGYVLINTMIVLIIFTSIVLSISQLKNLSFQQNHYLVQAQKNADCEYIIIKNVLSLDFENEHHFSTYCDETIINFEIEDEVVKITSFGELSFKLEIIVDLEMNVVKMYNYNAQ